MPDPHRGAGSPPYPLHDPPRSVCPPEPTNSPPRAGARSEPGVHLGARLLRVVLAPITADLTSDHGKRGPVDAGAHLRSGRPAARDGVRRGRPRHGRHQPRSGRRPAATRPARDRRPQLPRRGRRHHRAPGAGPRAGAHRGTRCGRSTKRRGAVSGRGRGSWTARRSRRSSPGARDGRRRSSPRACWSPRARATASRTRSWGTGCRAPIWTWTGRCGRWCTGGTRRFRAVGPGWRRNVFRRSGARIPAAGRRLPPSGDLYGGRSGGPTRLPERRPRASLTRSPYRGIGSAR